MHSRSGFDPERNIWKRRIAPLGGSLLSTLWGKGVGCGRTVIFHCTAGNDPKLYIPFQGGKRESYVLN